MITPSNIALGIHNVKRYGPAEASLYDIILSGELSYRVRTMAVKVVVVNKSGKRIGEDWLAARLRRVLRELGIAAGDWTVTAVGDAEIKELHGRTMGIWGTTDVLTFDMGGGSGRNTKHETRNTKHERRRTKHERRKTNDQRRKLELDTVVCVDEGRRRAGEMGHAVREELLLYAVHSLLHVQGYDDATAAQAAAMHRREDEILIQLGVGPVYSGKGKAGVSRAAGRARGSGGKRKGSS